MKHLTSLHHETRLSALLLAILCCTSTFASDIEAQLRRMTLREKVGQLFYIRPEALDTTIHWNAKNTMTSYRLQEVTPDMEELNRQYPVGGVVLYAHNIKDEAQLAVFVQKLKALNGSPLLCIDEEGGSVTRIACNDNFPGVERFESMEAIGRTGDPRNAYHCGQTIGRYLRHYGFDIDFAPVADVNTNPENVVIGARAFSDKPYVAAPMVTSYLQGLRDEGVVGCIKHFPGHGDTRDDTHKGRAQSNKTWDEMRLCEMPTFRAGIRWGADLIMTSHISVPNVTGSDIPATLSATVLQDKLRGELGYTGLIITDGMEMGAITQQYTSAEASVLSIKAGVDIVLGVRYFVKAFDNVMAAIERGEISEQRIDESVRRILRLKEKLRNPASDLTAERAALRQWKAGETVSQAAIDAFGGVEKCFAAEPIPDAVWQRMQGKTYKPNPHIGRRDLRHVRALHWDYDNRIHIGELVCNQLVADKVARIFRQLFEAHYPIQRMLLPDVYGADDERQMCDNNTSSFCYRPIAGSQKLSKHALGLAVDVNTLYNPYIRTKHGKIRFMQPSNGTDFCDRDWNFPYKIDKDDLCYRLFTEAGFEWGGSWKRHTDYQHFEYKGKH